MNLLKMRSLTFKGTMIVSKILAISKIVFLAILTKTPHQVVKELEKIQKPFLWKNSTMNIKY